MNEAFYVTAKELSKLGKDKIPDELISSRHLIYSSPAALAFNSPGAQGYGVKRAALAIPGSIMLLVSPGCCGRNTTVLGDEGGYGDRIFYLEMDDTDIVTGRHLTKIPQAVAEICLDFPTPPSVVMICITCVDALLGTDMERVCRSAQEASGVPVRPCYMYALTREGIKPPMAAVRESIYSMLEPAPKNRRAANILGFFSALDKDCELYELLASTGVTAVRELGACRCFSEFQKMSEANFNLVLNSEARLAAVSMEKRLGIPFIELTRLYRPEKIALQYVLLGRALGVSFEDAKYRAKAEAALSSLGADYNGARFSVGETLNANPFELSLTLVGAGFVCSEIFGTVTAAEFPYIKLLAELSPDTKIYSNLSPSMLFYEDDGCTELTIGKDAVYYHPTVPNLAWNGDNQPFGWQALRSLAEQLRERLAMGVAEQIEGERL